MVHALGEQGWRSGESARLQPMCPGFDSRTRRHCGFSLLLVPHCAPRGFSPVFPCHHDVQIPVRSWNALTFLN